MTTTWSRVTRVVTLLLVTQLSACYDSDNKPAPRTLNSFPSAITFDSEDNLYIATVSGNIFRYADQQLSKLIPRANHGLDFASSIRYSQNHLYIHNKRYAGTERGYVDEILLYSSNGRFIDHLINEDEVQANTFSAIDVNRHGQIYSICDAAVEKIFRINRDKYGLEKFNISPGLLTTFQPDPGQVTEETANPDALVAVEDANKLMALLAEQPPEVSKQLESILTTPRGIVTDQANNLYVSFTAGIITLDLHTGTITSVAKANQAGFGISIKMAIDPYGNLVVLNRYYENGIPHTNVLKFTPHEPDPHVFIPTGVIAENNSIKDMTFDSAGNLYIVDNLQGIAKFDQTGQFVDIIVKPF